MAKARRKYNPRRRQQQQLSSNLDALRATTFFYHGDHEDGTGAACGNCEHTLSAATASQLLGMKNRWSVMLLAFLDSGREQYVKTTTFTVSSPVERNKMQQILNERSDAWRYSHSANQLISIGWFMVPDSDVDLDDQRISIIELFESEGADNPETVNLGVMIRSDKLELEATNG